MFNIFETYQERMKRKLESYNSEVFDKYSDIVIYLSCDDILKLLKSEKFNDMVEINKNIRKIGDILKERYGFDEVLSFNNEISLIYLYEKQLEKNREMIYSGNRHEIITKVASEASCLMTQEMSDEENYIFKARYVVFDKDGDVENWKEWRQKHCETNIVSYLYKLVINKNINGMKKNLMIDELNKYGILEQEEIQMMLNK